MDFRVFIRTILDSSPEDWTRVDRPIFLQSVGEVVRGHGDNERHWLEVEEHRNLLTYKPNMSIAIAAGLPYRDEFEEPWTTCFPHRQAWTKFVDLLWNGMPVHREIGVMVDGGRCIFPLPLPGTREVPQGRFDFFGLIQNLTGATYDYQQYCTRAGLKPIPYNWPK